MASWDIEKTRKLIESRYGWEQLERARPCLRAVHLRLRHARYHFQEVKAILKTHIDDRLEKEDVFALLIPLGMEEWAAFDDWFMTVEAHMIACVQSIHSIADILAHVVHFALGINLGPNPLAERGVNGRSVIRYLSAHAPVYEEVRSGLENLTSNPSFVALDAIVNHTKHRGAVKPRLHIEPPNFGAPYAMEFGSFSYDGVTHVERELEEVIRPAYKAASDAVIDVGNAINGVISNSLRNGVAP